MDAVVVCYIVKHCLPVAVMSGCGFGGRGRFAIVAFGKQVFSSGGRNLVRTLIKFGVNKRQDLRNDFR